MLETKKENRIEEEQYKIIPIRDVGDFKLSTPVPSGIQFLDDKYEGGFRTGDLIVLGGRSGGGKSLLTLQLIKNYSNYGEKVLFFSYEEPVPRIKWRLARMGADVESIKCYVPKDLKSSSVGWLKEKILDGLTNKEIKIIAIDNLDFITIEKGLNNEDKWAVQGKIIGMLKRIAIMYKVIIILNVHIKKNDGSAPKMEDIYGSGDIYKIADTVIFIHRLREKNSFGVVDKDAPLTNESLISVEKNRLLGVCGSFKMTYVDGELKCLSSLNKPIIQKENGDGFNLDEVSSLF